MLDDTVRELRHLLSPADPAAGGAGVPGAGTRTAGLLRILATPAVTEAAHTRRRPVRRRWFLAGAGAVAASVVTAGVVLVAFDPVATPAYAATPAPLTYFPAGDPGPAALERIAVAAQAGTATPAGPEHLVVESWSLHGQVDGERVTSAVVPVVREVWRAADGSGRVVERYGAPVFRSEDGRRAWQQQGSPGADGKPRETVFPAGGFPGMWTDRPPAEAAALATWLQTGHPAGNGPMETLVAITDLARERVLSPAERAAVVRVLAGVPGIASTGAVTDRAGRHGAAFSVVSDRSGLPTRYTLILDPADGRLLGYEQSLTTEAGKLDVIAPAVIGYEIYR
ncbi:MAG TPA: CU044_5270 family protein [Actinoplanes sp.]|nr:CU044_5270 family protein [Actinoplanes sp.]